jgi:hypothetical protein
MGYNKDASGNQFFALKELVLGNTRFLRTDDGSAIMNINGLPAGTPLIVWNGDGAYWTASGDGSSTTEAAHTGSYGWDTGVRSNGDATLFSTSDFDIQASYDSISFWMNPQRKDVNTTLRLRWYHDGGTEGTIVIVDNYVTNFDIDVWQKVTIPLADFALPPGQLVDQLQFQYQSLGPKYEHFFLDDIELNPAGAGGGPFVFQVAAPANTLYHLSMLVLVMSAPGTGWNPNTFGNQTALENGLLLRQRRLSTAETLWSFNVNDNTDLFGRYHPQDDITFSDGTLLIGFMVKPSKASVIVSSDDVLEFVVRDNLSGLSSARAFAHYGVEAIS